MSAGKSKRKFFIVKRAVGGGYMPSSHYVKTATPNVGETIYHGDFGKRSLEEDNGPYGSTFHEVYEPVDKSKVTSEPYKGEGDEVESF